MYFWKLLGLSMLSSVFLTAAAAADVRKADRSTTGCDILISGEIVHGDYERFKELALYYRTLDEPAYKKDLNALRGVWPRTVCLNSPGGSYLEGVKIALDVNDYFATKLLPNSRCLSACALIFMSGTLIHPDHVLYRHYVEACYSNCEGWYPEPKRTMSPSSVLGFHAPYLDSKGRSSIAAAEVQEISQAVLQVSTFLLSETKNNFPIELASAMMSQGPNEMYFIDEVGQLTSWSIDLDSEYHPDLSVELLQRAWIMFASEYDYSDGGYGSVGDTRNGIKGPETEPNHTGGWDYYVSFGLTPSGAKYIQADGIGREASWSAVLVDYGDSFQLRALAGEPLEEYGRFDIRGWQLVAPTTKIGRFQQM